MLGISRWTESHGSYRTIQRFFYSQINRGKLRWLFTRFNTGKAVIVPFLQAQGIQTIDKLLISHGDNYHSCGADSVLKQLKVKQILSNVPERFKKNNSVL